jgi:RNA polymerase sigma-70 factor (ECF subfamily)
VTNDPATDSSNLLDLQRGDSSALNRIIDRWQRPLFSFAFRYVQSAADSQDLVAETFVRLHQHRLRLRPDSNLRAWLFTTLTNLCRNQHRWRRRHPSVPLGPAPSESAGGDPRAAGGWSEPQSPESGPGDSLARDEAIEALRGAIEALPHDLKVAVLLHHYEHLSYGEIAAVAGCSERGVETRLYRARQQLRSGLKEFIRESAPG